MDAYVEDGTVLTNAVTLNYEDPNDNPYSEESDSVDVTVTAPYMSITKTADVSEADPGDQITYTITYENPGTGDATNVVIEDTIDAEIGETINIQLQLLDPNTNNSIENASITYSWKYGVDSINQTSPGMYQANVNLPDNVKGNYKFDLTIIPENSTFSSYFLSISFFFIPKIDPFR